MELVAECTEFRNVLYYRLKQGSPRDVVVSWLASRVWRPLEQLELACPSIGPGLVILHGQGTIVHAVRIGSNFTVHHQVTLGWRLGAAHPPVVGDDVMVGVGARILGAVSVGDGAQIGANAVVVSDVPAYHVAVGVPARCSPRRPSGAESRDAADYEPSLGAAGADWMVTRWR